MKWLKADVVITNNGNPIANGLVGYDEHTGKIEAVLEERDFSGEAQQLRGVLIPGYVNAHCHLELSHLRNVIPTGKGLVAFISDVVQLRNFEKEIIDESIRKADIEMYQNGIVAVGDICNTTDTLEVKQNSKIHYHSFVEYFDLWQLENTANIIQQYDQVFSTFHSKLPGQVSKVPHATYSVSGRLFEYLKDNDETTPVSMHNQEFRDEDVFIDRMGGELLEFYKQMGLSTEHIRPNHMSSLRYALDQLNPSRHNLLVHNTCTSPDDIKAAQAWSPNIYCVSCPNSNLYIENRLPDYHSFMTQEVKLCVGTDSLSSNWQLSIFEEIKTIKKYQSTIPDVDLIKWATCNGAEALGISDRYGKIAPGLSPGLNLLEVEVRDGVFDLRDVDRSIRIL